MVDEVSSTWCRIEVTGVTSGTSEHDLVMLGWIMYVWGFEDSIGRMVRLSVLIQLTFDLLTFPSSFVRIAWILFFWAG